ncbi:MAG: hypothetical protein L6W00_18315 [Lentisphaeria bacterium]|nr:MAG: hypothetical protein L6W00_18315 [Lentisphaeria bacterium]
MEELIREAIAYLFSNRKPNEMFYKKIMPELVIRQSTGPVKQPNEGGCEHVSFQREKIYFDRTSCHCRDYCNPYGCSSSVSSEGKGFRVEGKLHFQFEAVESGICLVCGG